MSQASAAQDAACDLGLAAGGGDPEKGGLHSPAPPQPRLECEEPPPLLLIFKAGPWGWMKECIFLQAGD